MYVCKYVCKYVCMYVSQMLLKLGMQIQCNVRWNQYIFHVSKIVFKCLGSSDVINNSSLHLISLPLNATYIDPIETIQLSYMSQRLKVYFENPQLRIGEGQ